MLFKSLQKPAQVPPRSLEDCRTEDNVSSALWFWSGLVDKIGKITCLVLLSIGTLTFLLSFAAGESSSLGFITENFSGFAKLLAALIDEYEFFAPLYSFDALICYTIQAALAFVISTILSTVLSALASIVYNTQKSAKIAEYNAMKEESKQ